MDAQLKQQQYWVVTASVSIVAIVTIAFVLHYTQDVLIPFVVALFVGSMVSPLMDVLELRYRVRHTFAVLIALVVVVVATLLFGVVLVVSIKTIVNRSQLYSQRFEQLADGIAARARVLLPERRQEQRDDAAAEEPAAEQPAANRRNASETGTADVSKSTPPSATNGVADETQKPSSDAAGAAATDSEAGENPVAGISDADNPDADNPDAEVEGDGQDEVVVKREPLPPESDSNAMQEYLRGLIPRFAAQMAGSVVSFLSAGTLTLIFVMFILAGRNPRVVRQGVYAEIDTKVRSYIGTKVALSLATGVLVWVIFWSIEMPMAAVFGLLAFLLNFIPSVGSVIATLIPIPFALAMYPNFFHPGAAHDMDQIAFLLAVVCLPGSVQLLIGNVLEPNLMGQDLKLHPIAILLALAIWGLLWGAIGMLLAVPITASIRIVLMRFEITRVAGRLLAGELPDLDALTTAEEPPTGAVS